MAARLSAPAVLVCKAEPTDNLVLQGHTHTTTALIEG